MDSIATVLIEPIRQSVQICRETPEPSHRFRIPVRRHGHPVLDITKIPAASGLISGKPSKLVRLRFAFSIEASNRVVDGLGPGAIGLVGSPTGSSFR